jgi:hypothetical protein
MINSRMECPEATKMPVYQPRRGAWLTIAAETGPGETTAPIPTLNENSKTANRDEAGSMNLVQGESPDFTTYDKIAGVELAPNQAKPGKPV